MFTQLARPFRSFTAAIRRPGVVPVAIIVAFFMAVFDNLPLWTAVWQLVSPLTPDNLRTLASIFVAVLLLFIVMVMLFGSRYVFKPALIILLLAAATASYFMTAFGVVVDRSMIQNLFETDLKEAAELVSGGFLLHLLLYGLAPAFLLWRAEIRYETGFREFRRRTVVVSACLLLAGLAIFTSYKEIALIIRQNRHLRLLVNPSYPVYALATYTRQSLLGDAPKALEPIGGPVVQSPPGKRRERKRVVVFVLGETARAANFSLNGYPRETNPELRRQAILNFSNTSSCATSTADSLPCLFSGMTRENYRSDLARRRENLLDLLTRAGIQVLWRDNNSGSKGVAARVPYEEMAGTQDDELCRDGECFDEILLKNLATTIAKASGDLFVVLHQKGSHGPLYYKRVPDTCKEFAPECRQDDVQKCSREEIVNAYDNTILYTDRFLAETIDLLRELSPHAETALLYMSDHGESLGENGIYLHGAPYFIAPGEQTHIPFVAWLSDAFARDAGIDLERAKGRQDAEFSHDNLFHTVLGLFSVTTEAYRPELDVFADRGPT